jgi:transposase
MLQSGRRAVLTPNFPGLLRLIEKPKIRLTRVPGWIRVGDMIRGGFLSADERRALIELARDGLAEHRLARRANAVVLLDKGWNCDKVAGALLLDDDTVRSWFRAYEKEGVEGLRNFGHEGSSCRLSEEQQTALKAWVSKRLPRSTNPIGAWLEKNYGLRYSHAGLNRATSSTGLRILHAAEDTSWSR